MTLKAQQHSEYNHGSPILLYPNTLDRKGNGPNEKKLKQFISKIVTNILTLQMKI